MPDHKEPAAGKSERFAYLDVIRGLAACIVVATHIFELGIPNFRKVAGDICNWGLLGVLLFFIVSGTVISASIERSKSLTVFWKQRFWRLFPAYWVSLIFSAGLFLLVPSELNFPIYGQIKNHFWSSFGANLTMLQGFLGFDHFIPAYWTLGFEMLFYFALSFLFALRLGKQAHKILWFIGAILLFAGVYGLYKGVHVGSFKVALCGYFWFGIWVHRFLNGDVSAKKLLAVGVAFQLGIAMTWYANFYVHPAKVAEAYSEYPFLPVAMAVAFFGATAIFLAFLNMRTKKFPRFLIVLGNVSYSLYLFHSIAIRIGGMMFDTKVAPIQFTTVTLILTAILTAAAYRFVEVPSLRKVKAVKLAAS